MPDRPDAKLPGKQCSRSIKTVLRGRREVVREGEGQGGRDGMRLLGSRKKEST